MERVIISLNDQAGWITVELAILSIAVRRSTALSKLPFTTHICYRQPPACSLRSFSRISRHSTSWNKLFESLEEISTHHIETRRIGKASKTISKGWDPKPEQLSSEEPARTTHNHFDSYSGFASPYLSSSFPQCRPKRTRRRLVKLGLDRAALVNPPPIIKTGPVFVFGPSIMKSELHFITTPTADTPGTALILATPQRNYVFGNQSEGFQRAVTQTGQL